MTLVGGMTDAADQLEVWRVLLGEVDELRHRADQIEFRAVELVRSTGVTWEDIGDALGISRQSARERFGAPRRRRRRRPSPTDTGDS